MRQKNINGDPALRGNDVVGNILKYTAGTAALLLGAHFISTFVIFTGKDFRTPDLTDEHIKLMDSHNQYHAARDHMNSFSTGMFERADAEGIVQNTAANWKKAFDASISALPGELAHKH